MSHTLRDDDLESEAISHASSCQEREAAIRCWRRIADASGLQDKVLADAAGMTQPHYSKVAGGVQGDLLGMVYRIGRTYPELKRDFMDSLHELEHSDPLARAAELLAVAAMRFLRLQGVERNPLRMARADLPEGRKRGIA